MDTGTSRGSYNAGLVESVAGEVEGREYPCRNRQDGQGVGATAAESGAASVDRCYLRVPRKAPASERRISLWSAQLPFERGLSEPIAPKAPDLPATAEP